MASNRIVHTARAMFLVPSILWIVFAPGALMAAPLTRNINSSPALASTRLQRATSSQQKGFRPAGVISASDVEYPIQTTVDGIVVFNVSINAGGTITNMNALTDIPPLTSVAESSLRSWKFMPASAGGATETSQMLVAFVFRHAVKAWNPPSFSPVFASREQAGYMSAGIFSATYADYPMRTIAAGAIVLEDTIKADGIVSNVKVVRGMGGGFVPLAMKAARQWEFEPAMLDGTPVMSNVAIAFVFSSRALNPF